MKRMLALLLVFAMLLPLAACGKQEENSATNAPAASKAGSASKTDRTTLSPENTKTSVNGVTVDVGDFVLEEETELTVSTLPEVTAENGDWKIQPYEISLGEWHELEDYITIRIPYDDSFVDAGEDPAQCVAAKYKNEETGDWEDVLYEVDAEAQEILIHTNHLSIFGPYYIRNASLRDAHITAVFGRDFHHISKEEALKVLQEYVSNGGNPGKESLSLATKLLSLQQKAGKWTATAAGHVGTGSDTYSTIMNLATLGDPIFDKELAGNLHKGMGYLGQVAAAAKIGSVILSMDKTDEDILGIFKDSAMLAMSFSSSKSIGLACNAIFVLDYSVSKLFEEGKAIKHKKINDLYVFFNDEFIGELAQRHWKARKLKDWREILIEIVQTSTTEEEVRERLTAEVDSYCQEFWKLGAPDHALIILEMKNKTTKGSVTIPDSAPSDRKELTEAYKAHLYERLHPVLTSVKNYMQKQLEEEYMKALKAMRDEYNKTITLTIMESLSEEENGKYDGYTVRLGPLSEIVEPSDWQTTMLGKSTSLEFTLVAFELAGFPAQVQLFKPGANPDTDPPELTVNYQLSSPLTVVNLDGGDTAFPTIDELVGHYADGSMAITGTTLTPDEAEGFGLALNEAFPYAFEIGKTTVNQGTLLLEGDDVPVIFTYDVDAGRLVGTTSASDTGVGEGLFVDLNVVYNEGRTVIQIEGTGSLFDGPDQYDFSLKGSKSAAE